MTRLAVQHRARSIWARASRTSPRPTSSRRRPRAPSPPTTTSTRRRRACPGCARPSPSTSSAATAGAVDPDSEVTVTGGATEALFDAILALLDPGDEAIVFEPFYDAYVPDIQMAGGTPRVVTLRPPDWRFDPDELRGRLRTAHPR